MPLSLVQLGIPVYWSRATSRCDDVDARELGPTRGPIAAPEGARRLRPARGARATGCPWVSCATSIIQAFILCVKIPQANAVQIGRLCCDARGLKHQRRAWRRPSRVGSASEGPFARRSLTGGRRTTWCSTRGQKRGRLSCFGASATEFLPATLFCAPAEAVALPPTVLGSARAATDLAGRRSHH